MEHLALIFMLAALPVPMLLLGETLARRSKGGPFKRFWRRHVIDNND